jgi:hypothetical protein
MPRAPGGVTASRASSLNPASDNRDVDGCGFAFWGLLLGVSFAILSFGIVNAAILGAGMCFGMKPVPSYFSEWTAPGVMALSAGVSALPFVGAFLLRPNHRLLAVFGAVVFAAIALAVLVAFLCPNPNFIG